MGGGLDTYGKRHPVAFSATVLAGGRGSREQQTGLSGVFTALLTIFNWRAIPFWEGHPATNPQPSS